MKKNFLNGMMKATLVVGISSVLGSCGSYIGYDDGIYGENAPRHIAKEPRYERPTHETQSSYKAYLQQKANGYSDFQGNMQQPSYTPLTDVNSYRTPEQNQQPTYNSYAGWGDNPSQNSVIVYNNYGYGGHYHPYWDWNYRHNYYWGSGAWGYPYSHYYGYNYYRPYRSGWSITIGSGYPYYGGGYYGYYGSYYSPYYYGYNYYPYYYGYYPYERYYNGGYYNNGRKHNGWVTSRGGGVRGDSQRYEQYRQSNTQSNSYNNGRSNTYSRSYQEHNSSPTPSPMYRSDNSSRSYNNSYDNSSRSYNSGGGNYNNSGNGAGTTRRNF